MARTFPADFAAHCNDSDAKPYLILEVQWGGSTGTKYYLDRPVADFEASGTRAPTSDVASELVESWGQLTLSLKEAAIGGVDTWTVRIIDSNRALRVILNADAQQRKLVKLYRMWDAADVTWPDDAALIFVGSLRPHSWTDDDGVVEFEVEDASKRLLSTIETIATRSVFPRIPDDYRDKNIPLVWGQAHRVEAVLVDRPWQSTTLQAVPRSTSPPFAIPIFDHPDDMGVTELGSSGSPIEIWLGSDLILGYLTQSGTPDTVPSTLTLTSWEEVANATAVIQYALGTGSGRYAVVSGRSINPPHLRGNLTSVVTNGTPCLVLQAGKWEPAAVATIAADDPFLGAYKITFSESGVTNALNSGQGIKFLSETETERSWNAGTVVRPKEGDWVYAANALPSKAVVKVEGFGELQDDSGETFKDFVLLGGSITDGLDGTVVTEDEIVTPYVVNLNDDTWKYLPEDPEYLGPEDLRKAITTITFDQPPRQVNPSLEDNRLWVTLQGVETQGDSFGNLIANAALAVLWYLESPHLMFVDSEDIDQDSFIAAATATNAQVIGFAQTESADGLTLLQDICRQCRMALFFDRGKVTIKVLSNSPGTSVATFTNDNIQELSLSYSETSVDDLVTRLKAKWRDSWDDRTSRQKEVLAINVGAEAEFGRVARDIDLYLYARRPYAASEVGFWLTRWSKVYREIEFASYRNALHVQPNDWITLNWLEGVFHRGADLAVHDSVNTRVSSAGYVFTAADVNRKLLVCDGSGWTVAVYNIDSVTDGSANLDASPASVGTSGGVFVLGAGTIFSGRLCEVVEVTDDPGEQVVIIRCRYAAFTF